MSLNTCLNSNQARLERLARTYPAHNLVPDKPGIRECWRDGREKATCYCPDGESEPEAYLVVASFRDEKAGRERCDGLSEDEWEEKNTRVDRERRIGRLGRIVGANNEVSIVPV